MMSFETARSIPKVNNKLIAKVLLSGFIKKLLRESKYMEACINNHGPLKAYHCLLHKKLKKTNSNLSSC